MKHSRFTRKQKNLYAFLIAATVLSTTSAQAQSFAPLSPVEALVNEVADGTAQVVQFKDLEAFALEQQLKSDITNLATDEAANVYFEEIFDVDGAFGELKDGTILEDWETIGIALGTSAAVAVGAYSLWYRQRREYLERLRSGDVALIEDLFVSSTDDLASFNTTDWEAWAIEKGLPGTATLLMSLFGIWSRRNERDLAEYGNHEDLLESVYDDNPPTSISRYRSAVLQVAREQQAIETEKALVIYSTENPAPMPPEIPRSIEILKNLHTRLSTGLDMEAIGRPANESRKYGYNITAVTSLLTTYQHEFSADIIAEQAIEALETLQAAATVSWNRNHPNFSRVYLGYNYNFIERSYKGVQQALQTWLRTNRSKLDANTLAQLTPLSYEPVLSQSDKYLQRGADLQSVFIAEQEYSQRHSVWNIGAFAIQKEISDKYQDVSNLSYDYWRARYQEKSDQFKQTANLSDLVETSEDYFTELEVHEKDEFGTEILAYLATKSADDASKQIQQFLDWTSSADLSKNVTAYFEAFLSADEEIQTLETELLDDTLTWSVVENKKSQLAATATKKSQYLDQIWRVRSVLLATADESDEQSLLQSELVAFEGDVALAENKVHQWLTTQEKDRVFAEQYGVYDREEYLQQKITELETVIDFGTLRDERYINGTHIGQAKLDLNVLKNGEIPDFYWSATYWGGDYQWGRYIPYTGNTELNHLNYWLLEQGTSWSARNTDRYLEQLAARDALVEKLAIERAAVWESRQTEILTDKFSEAEIAAYEALKKNAEVTALASARHEAQQDEKAVQYATAITTANQNYATQQISRNEIFIPFTALEVETIALNQEVGVTVPDFLSDVYFESYRRFQTDKTAFADEVMRLAAQAKDIARMDQIQKRNIPHPPVQTKEVRDYLSDPQRTADDVDREIAEVRAGIEILKAEQVDPNTVASRKNYLTTALEQADLKIAALERYKALGPVATEAYLLAVENYENTHALTLQEVDRHLDEIYQNVDQYVDGYWDIASDLLAQKQSENDYIPPDPDTIELAEPAPTEAEIQANLDAGWANLVSKMPTFNPALLNAQLSLSNVGGAETWDPVTDARIKELNPALHTNATQFINQVEKELGIRLRVSDGVRSFEQQAALYDQGRTTDGDIVTNAGAGLSYHNYGQAIDVVEIKDGVANYDLDWDAIGAIGKQFGFEWGGDWTEISDRPHFQMTLGQTPQQLLLMRNAGQLVDDRYFDQTEFDRLAAAAELETKIATNISEGRGLAESENTYGPRIDLELQNYANENPDKILELIPISTTDSEIHQPWEDVTLINSAVRWIKEGTKGFTDFQELPTGALTALMNAAAEEDTWFKTFISGNHNLENFVTAAKKELASRQRAAQLESFTKELLGKLNDIALDYVGPTLYQFALNKIAPSLVTVELAQQFAVVIDSWGDFNASILDGNKSAADSAYLKSSQQLEKLGEMIAATPEAKAILNEQLGAWHFEERIAKNIDLPNYESVISDGSWVKISADKNLLHDNGIGEKEIKFVNLDGREVIYDGDSKKIITDPNLIGTYNYGVLLNDDNYLSKVEYNKASILHTLLDVFPYYALGGNVR